MPQSNPKTASAQEIDSVEAQLAHFDPEVNCNTSACASISVKVGCLLLLGTASIAMATLYQLHKDDANDPIAANATQELLNTTFQIIEIIMNGTATNTATQTQTNTPTHTGTETPSATPTHTSTYTRTLKACVNGGASCRTTGVDITSNAYVDQDKPKAHPIGLLLFGAIAAGVCVLPILAWIAKSNHKQPCSLRLFSQGNQGGPRQVSASTSTVSDEENSATPLSPRPGSTTASD